MANIEAYGTNIVGSGGSGGGGLTQQEHEWLESLASYTPNMYDINAEKNTAGNVPGRIIVCADTDSPRSYIPVCGYDKIAFYQASSGRTMKYKWLYSDGTMSEETTLTYNTWTDYISIPANVVCVVITAYYSSMTYSAFNYSLLTKDSLYNPDNQT
jgi:hypothetical protein